MTETGEYILVQTLLELVDHDDYYSVNEIRQEMDLRFDEDQRWLTNKWVGRALKRLGIKEKCSVGGRIQYRLTTNIIKDLAERFGISVEPEDGDSRETTPTTSDNPLATLISKPIKSSEICDLC